MVTEMTLSQSNFIYKYAKLGKTMKTLIAQIQDVDARAFLWCNRSQNYPSLTQSARWVSRSGDGHLYIAIGGLLAFFEPAQGLNFFLFALLAFAFEVPGFLLLKKLIKRDRPFTAMPNLVSTTIEPADKFSLPSGHTAAAFVMATMLVAFYPVVAPLAFAWAVLVGASRVILGVHYPLDILAGAVLGTACSGLVLSVMS